MPRKSLIAEQFFIPKYPLRASGIVDGVSIWRVKDKIVIVLQICPKNDTYHPVNPDTCHCGNEIITGLGPAISYCFNNHLTTTSEKIAELIATKQYLPLGSSPQKPN